MIEACNADSLQRAVALLQAGELVAFPTETVYGLGADAANPAAVARIFAAKGRPSDHPVIVHLAEGADLSSWAADVPPAARLLVERFWPGPLTLILRRAKGVPDAVTGGQDTVGIRCPAHPVAQALLLAFAEAGGSGALAAPSANRFGRISPTTAAHVADEFGDRVPLILDGGRCDVGIESTILDLSRGRPILLRPGRIDAAALEECLGEAVFLPGGTRATAAPVAAGDSANARPKADARIRSAAGEAIGDVVAGATPRVSGSLTAHYAPRTPLELVDPARLAARVEAALSRGESVGVWSRAPVSASGVTWRQAPTRVDEYAHLLYALLRDFDAAGLDRLLVEAPPSDSSWMAVRDRLGRAAAGSG